jgi:hypothetical protein
MFIGDPLSDRLAEIAGAVGAIVVIVAVGELYKYAASHLTERQPIPNEPADKNYSIPSTRGNERN